MSHPVEIVPGDGLYEHVVRISARADTLSVLEIGCSDGQGSTSAIVKGFGLRHPDSQSPRLFCIDSNPERTSACRDRYKNFSNVTVLCGLSCGEFDVAPPEEIAQFNGPISAAALLSWRAGWEQFIAETKPRLDQVSVALSLNRGPFDCAILDGGEFSARYELNRVYGARWIVLDDTQGFKNAANYQRMKNDKSYILVDENQYRRYGWAVFGKKGEV